MRFTFDAYVTQALFDGDRAVFTLGDGTVTWEDGARIAAHDGAILCAAPHPVGDGVITGGDDGRLVWSRPDGAAKLASLPGRWIDALAVSQASGLIAFAGGRALTVLDAADPAFTRVFSHDKTVAAIAFDPKGRRLAAATYGGAALWYARIAEQRPVMLRWAGSHVGLAFSPDGRFLVSSMQEAALHGWRLTDATDMRMGGYPSKVKSLAFLDGGQWLATSGAHGVVMWPFGSASGPMGKQASQLGFDEAALVARVAGAARGPLVAAGLDNGEIWTCDLASPRTHTLKPDQGPPITAVTLLDQTRLAWGDEAGGAGVESLPAAF